MSFEVKIVEAESVSDYLNRYYKKDRLLNADNAYGPGTLLSIYELEYRVFGLVCTSHFDNITGEFIAWPIYREATQEECDRYNELRAELDKKVSPQASKKIADEKIDNTIDTDFWSGIAEAIK